MYGNAPEEWKGNWLRVPEPIMQMYVVMMPRLEAERSLDAINAAFAAAGTTLEDQARSEMLNQLTRRAEGARRRRVKPDMSELTGAGIEVVREDVPSRQEPEEGGDDG